MRRNTTLALVLAAALAAVLWFAFGSRTEQVASAPAPEVAPNVVDPAVVNDDAPLAEVPPRESAAPETARTEAAVAPTAVAQPARCVVFGRLVDDRGAPIGGAAVRLCAYKTWAEGLDLPRLSGRYDYRGFEVATETSGAFRIEAPVPTAERTKLTIFPDRFHDSVTMYFAAEGQRVLPPLVAGERDLGELRVANTGALTGRVLDAQGQPLADVEISIGNSRSTTFERDTQTGLDGSYVVAHAPVGTYGVCAKSEQHLAHFEAGLNVAAGADTFVKDIVLQPAPTLEGTVVDERGTPLADVRLSGWPVGSGGGSIGRGTSDADGRFVIPLPQTDPFTLSAKLDGYERWGSEHDHSVTYAPGRHDIAIVMHTLPRTRFTVVDAETKAPIERFGVNILEDNGSRSQHRVWTERRPPPQSAHPGGVAEATARVGVDLYLIAADGYVLASGDVKYDVPDVPVQTVRMSRGAGVRGRVVRDGEPLADVLVEIVQVSGYATDTEGKSDSDRYYTQDETRRQTRTDGEGRFTLSALEKGEHRLTVRPATGAPLVLQPVKVRAKKTSDLGDLEVRAGATIVGELLAPAGFDPAGVKVFLDDWKDNVTALVDGAGRFRFENVPAGVRFLMHDERAGALAGGQRVRVEVKAGETLTVTLDARDRAMCAVELHVDLGDIPTEHLQVDLLSADGAEQRESLGNCDASGRVRGSVRAFGRAHVGVYLHGFRFVQHPEAALELQPFGKVEATVRFEFARLDVRVRGVLPRDGRVRFQFTPRAAAAESETVEITYKDGAALGESAVLVVRADRVSIGGLLAGAYSVRLEVFDDKPDPANAERHRARVHAGATPTYTATAEIDLVAGQRLEIEL